MPFVSEVLMESTWMRVGSLNPKRIQRMHKVHKKCKNLR